MSSSTSIGIIGGGPAAVCLLDALSQQTEVPKQITVFEPSQNLWRGRPYAPDSTVVRVNAPPEDMSVRFSDDQHFERWLEARTLVLGARFDYVDPWSDVRFVPRAAYGDYLEQSARSALIDLAMKGCQVDVVRHAVTRAVPVTDGIVVQTAAAHRHRFDHIVLCVGGGRPADVYQLVGSPGFVEDPYPAASQLARIPTDRHIVVLGSGLTAIDTVLALVDHGHQGRISLLSRRSVLPSVRQRSVSHPLRHFTSARFRAMADRGQDCTLVDAIAIMQAELVAAPASLSGVLSEITAISGEGPVDRLRRQLGAVNSRDVGLRILQRAVPDTGPDIWPLLPEADKAMLRSQHYRTIMSLCCPMPPASAAQLLALIDSGHVDVPLGLSDVHPVRGGFRVNLGDNGRFTVPTVVNGMDAPPHRIPPGAKELIESLTEAGVAAVHPHGGLAVQRSTSRMTVDNRPDSRLYALGDLAAGSLFFTFGICSLVDRAHDIATAIGSLAVDPLSAKQMQAV